MRRGVDRDRDAAAQDAQLARAEHELSDRCTSSAVDEEIGPERRKLQLHVLYSEQVLNRFWHVAVAVLDRRVELPQLIVVLGQRQPPVEVDLERLGLDVAGGHVRIDASVDTHGTRRHTPLARQLRNGFGQQLDVQLEAERRYVTRLLV